MIRSLLREKESETVYRKARIAFPPTLTRSQRDHSTRSVALFMAIVRVYGLMLVARRLDQVNKSNNNVSIAFV